VRFLVNLVSRRQFRSIAVAVVCLIGLDIYVASMDSNYPIKDWLFWQLLVLWGWCALLHVACLASGHLILSRWLKVRDRPFLETMIISVAVGLVAFTMAMFLAGALALYQTWFALALPIVMIVTGGPSLLPLLRDSRTGRKTTATASPWTDLAVKAAMVGGVILLGLVYLQCMTPAALNYDSRWYHLAIAQDYAREGRIVPFPADYNKSFPHLASIVHTWGWLLPGLNEPLRWMLALHNEYCLLLWALAGVSATAAWLVERVRVKGAWVAFFLFPIIFDYDSNLGGGADHFVGFFAAPVFLAAVRAARDLSPRHCALVGVLTAGAVLSKYQAIYLVVPVAILMVWRWLWLSIASARNAEMMDRLAQLWRARFWRGPLALLAVGALLTAPHFLKNWIFYRNPLYPFMTAMFSGSQPRQPDSPMLVTYLLTGDSTVPRGPLLKLLARAVRLAITFSFHYKITIFGSLFTLLVPAILFLRGRRRLGIGVLFSMIGLVTWAFTYPVERYVQCIFPILAGVTAAIIVRAWELGIFARIGLVALIGFQIVVGGDIPYYAGQGRMDDALNLLRSGHDGRAKTRFDHYFRPQLAIGRRLPSNAVVLFHNTRLSLGVNRTVLQDLPGYQGLIDYRSVRTSRELCQMYRSHGITHIVHERSVWPALSKQEEVVFAGFLARFAPNTFSEGEYEVIELPSELPPQEPPYRALLLGLGQYDNGVYPVDALGLYEPLPSRFKQRPVPERSVTSESAGLPEVIEHVNAVLIEDTVTPSPDLQLALQDKFVKVLSFSNRFTVWSRRDLPNDSRMELHVQR
jgi:hypothetical protein